MIRRNSSSLISPSPSRSASSIISWSSSSVMFSPAGTRAGRGAPRAPADAGRRAELLGDAFQVPERDLPRLVVVEESERLQDLFTTILLTHLRRHHLEELGEVDRARAVLVDVRDHLLDLLLLGLEAEGAHGNLELLGVDRAAPIRVEEVEGLADLLLLLLGQLELLGLLLPTRSHPGRSRRRRRGGTAGLRGGGDAGGRGGGVADGTQFKRAAKAGAVRCSADMICLAVAFGGESPVSPRREAAAVSGPSDRPAASDASCLAR